MIILRYHLSWLSQQHILENFHRESLGRSMDDSIRETSPGEATRQVRAQQEIPWSGPWATRQQKQQNTHKNRAVFFAWCFFFLNWNSFLREICKSLVFTRLLASLRTYWLQFLPNKVYQTIYIYYICDIYIYVYILYIFYIVHISKRGKRRLERCIGSFLNNHGRRFDAKGNGRRFDAKGKWQHTLILSSNVGLFWVHFDFETTGCQAKIEI